ncbi:MAG: GxxExxY protein [bacterium]|nr:GxxExxY protein [bacterium]
MTIENPDLLYPELSYEITGAIFVVWKNLGSGYKESVYQKALEQELSNRGIQFSPQANIPIIYEGKRIGVYVPDFVIDGKIILEIKHLPRITFKEKKQIWHYLKGTDYKLLLLVNFGGSEVEIVRWVYDKARNAKNANIR